MNDFNSVVGGRIKEKRLEIGFTRENLARKSRISDKFLYDIEVGNKGMSAETLYKVAKALGVSTDWLLDGQVDSETTSD